MQCQDFLPFGEELAANIGHRNAPGAGYISDQVRQKFDGYERDAETGLDFAQARYFSSVQSRFTSIDPLLASSRLTLPQSWNRYAFTLNNPLRLIDPSGMNDQDPQEEERRRQQQELERLERQRQELERQRQEFQRQAQEDLERAAMNVEQIIEPTGTVNAGANSLSNNGLLFIAGWEGFVPTPYNDVANNATIGYGHLLHYGPVTQADVQQYPNGKTQQQGLNLLRADAAIAENAVTNNVTVLLNQNQFDALTSFTFNVGVQAFTGSTLLRDLNAGNYVAVPGEMNRWVYAGGQRVQGLVNRRAAEGALFSRAP